MCSAEATTKFHMNETNTFTCAQSAPVWEVAPCVHARAPQRPRPVARHSSRKPFRVIAPRPSSIARYKIVRARSMSYASAPPVFHPVARTPPYSCPPADTLGSEPLLPFPAEEEDVGRCPTTPPELLLLDRGRTVLCPIDALCAVWRGGLTEGGACKARQPPIRKVASRTPRGATTEVCHERRRSTGGGCARSSVMYNQVSIPILSIKNLNAVPCCADASTATQRRPSKRQAKKDPHAQ